MPLTAVNLSHWTWAAEELVEQLPRLLPGTLLLQTQLRVDFLEPLHLIADRGTDLAGWKRELCQTAGSGTFVMLSRNGKTKAQRRCCSWEPFFHPVLQGNSMLNVIRTLVCGGVFIIYLQLILKHRHFLFSFQ